MIILLQVSTGTAVTPLETLGVKQRRRCSRPSISPERAGVTPGVGSPSRARRQPRLRRQSTTLDEGNSPDVVYNSLHFLPPTHQHSFSHYCIHLFIHSFIDSLRI